MALLTLKFLQSIAMSLLGLWSLVFYRDCYLMSFLVINALFTSLQSGHLLCLSLG